MNPGSEPTGDGVFLHPQYREQKEKLGELREVLAELIRRREDLLHLEKPNLESLYLSRVGFRKVERLNLEIQARRLRRKIDLVRRAVNHGEEPDEAAIDHILEEELQKWRDRAERLIREVRRARQWEAESGPIENLKEMKSLYRRLALLLHPDLNPEQDRWARTCWQRLQEAYRDKDWTAMKTVALLVEDLPESPDPVGGIGALGEKITRITDRIRSLDREITRIRSEFPFTLARKIADPDWVKEELLRLDRETAKLAERIHRLQCHLAELLASLTDGGPAQ